MITNDFKGIIMVKAINIINGYSLSRIWFDFVLESSEKVTPMHTALYLWIVELNNKLKWKKVFGLPTMVAMQASCIGSSKTFKNTFDDLVRWGFITLISKSYNQYSSTQIALVLKTKADDEANTKQRPKQSSNQIVHNKTIQTVESVQTGEDLSNSEEFSLSSPEKPPKSTQERELQLSVSEEERDKRRISSQASAIEKIDIRDSDSPIRKEDSSEDPEKSEEERVDNTTVLIDKLFDQFKKYLISINRPIIEGSSPCYLDMENMVRIDKYSISDISKVIAFVQGDTFWRERVFTISYLRKKFTDLLGRAKKEGVDPVVRVIKKNEPITLKKKLHPRMEKQLMKEARQKDLDDIGVGLYQCCGKYKQNKKLPEIPLESAMQWSVDIELMLDAGNSKETIIKVISYIERRSVWMDQIQSANDFRRLFSEIVKEMSN